MTTERDESRVSRRRVVQVAGATVVAPSFATVVRGATQSGNVELTTTTTIPTDTSISIRVYEDLDGDGTADNEQEETITGGTDVITEYAALNGTEGQGHQYWFDVNLSTSDDTVTPEMDSMTITLPETPSTPTATATPTQTPVPEKEPQTAFDLWENYSAFVGFIVLAYTVIGAWSKSLAVGAFAGYMAFLYLALNSGSALFEQIAYVTLILVFIGFAFKLTRLELTGES